LSITFCNGNKYVGEWKDDEFNGQGFYLWKDGRTYVGEFKDRKKNGQGTLTNANGTIYHSGLWKDGNPVK